MSPSTIASIVGWALLAASMAVHMYGLCLKDKEREQRQVEQYLRDRAERIRRM